ncbi:hypothetical protein [Nocardioides sp.]|uniref:hypothetical protein n=1 Tax=Nocardioides sp. TaxID=35761 RepID=UPI003D0A969C
MAGLGQFKNRDAHELVDNGVFSDRRKRELQRIVATDDTKWSRMMDDHYGTTANDVTRDLDSVLRICETGSQTVDGIVEELRNGEITPTEAAKAIGAARRDLDKLRKVTSDAANREEQTWSEVDCTPADYQERLMKRAPQLFRNGRNLVVLPIDD